MKPTGKVAAILNKCLWALWTLLILAPLRSAADTPTEYQLKLVYLYNFTKFVAWPESAFASAEAPFNICVLGTIQETDLAIQLNNRQVRNRPITYQQLTTYSPQAQCHILFVTRNASAAQWQRVTTNLEPYTLLVGETTDFAKTKGSIGFILDDTRHIRLEINLKHAQRQQLTIRAQLLEIAKTVYRDEERS